MLDLDGDSVAVDQHHAAGDGQVVGENLDLVSLGRIKLNTVLPITLLRC